MKKILLKLIYLLPQKVRNKILWRQGSIRLALSSVLNIPRNAHDMEMAEKFNTYLNNNIEKNKKIQDLKNNLNEESAQEVDNIMYRYYYFLRHNLIDQNKLFSKIEIKEQKEWIKEEKKLKKYINNFNIKNYCIESFFGINGLRWLPKNIKEKINNGIFFDIGSCDGDSMIMMDLVFKPKKIYAFEPEKNNYSRLCENAKKIKSNNISCVNLGISDKEDIAYINSNGGQSKIINKKEGVEINLTTIDNFVQKNYIEKIDVIKMDIEGLEMSALLGAVKSIKNFKPVLAISIYHSPEDFFEIKPWIEKTFEGYNFIIKKANPFSLNAEIVLLAYTK